MCLYTKNIINSRDIVFIEDNMSVGNNFEMSSRERMKALQRFLWTNLPNHFCVVVVRNGRNRWEII